MRTVTVKCDLCGEEPPKRIDTGLPQTWIVSITCKPDDYHRSQYHLIQREQQAEWCSKCVERMGVRRPLVRADEPPVKPTLESIIREIVREEQVSE